MPLNEVKVSVLDRAFLLGDAVYEVVRVYSGRPWKLDEHISRLQNSLKAIRIDTIDIARINLRVLETLKNSHVQEGLIYLQITRGEAKRSHSFPLSCVPNELIYVEEFSDPYVELRLSGASAITYPDIRWAHNYIKATSLLANCLASQAATEAGAVEALLVDSTGYITEGSHTSVFAVKDGHILLSPDSPNILPGITRKLVLTLAGQSNISIKDHKLKASELPQIDELFLSGTPEEILPVTSVDNKLIGQGVVGPIVKQLQESLRLTLAAWLNLKDNDQAQLLYHKIPEQSS
ncbi:MAG: aminotransferase class IV [Candidatus Melainabacteria bacterium]|nr:aminotransferase class IV [Candidatus Melainabacteria bacterium]